MSFNTKYRTGRFVRAFIKNPSEPISYKILWSKVAGLPIAEDLCIQEENELHETRKSINKQLKKIGLSLAFEKTRITDAKNPIKKIWLNPKYSIQ